MAKKSSTAKTTTLDLTTDVVVTEVVPEVDVVTSENVVSEVTNANVDIISLDSPFINEAPVEVVPSTEAVVSAEVAPVETVEETIAPLDEPAPVVFFSSKAFWEKYLGSDKFF